MTNKELANLIFPNITKTIEDYEKMYPERNIDVGAKVVRFAPSPTGFMHIGNFMSAVINYCLAKSSKGVFFLRNEDTDQARTVEGAVDFIYHILDFYNIMPDEYEYKGKIVGNYGPYIQSERIEIYHAFVKHLIEIGRAYPCFLTKEELEEIREYQTKSKKRIGIYGKYAKSRNLTLDEAAERIKKGEKFVIRFKSEGDFNKKFVFEDLTQGKIEFPENDLDIPIMKSGDLLPTYHFAHLVDDHLMHTTHVVRGNEWLSSVPLHYELFKTFGFKMPKYIHTSLILKKDGDVIRKISKRKDPEALMFYYEEKGYPTIAVIDAVLTIANSNYEEWRTNNPDKPFYEFPFSPKKMSVSGALFDLDKLDNISKNYISKMSAPDLYQEYLNWALKNDKHIYEIISKEKSNTIKFLNIEREVKKPRKDYENYSSIFNKSWYMYDEEFNKKLDYHFGKINDKKEILNIMNNYLDSIYDFNDSQDEWFNKIKEYAKKLNYADMKEYKENPDSYKGNIADFTTVIRVVLTTLDMTPNLYDIMQILGSDRMLKRLEIFKNSY